MRPLLALLALTLMSCHTGSSNTMAGAAVMTTLALGASAANRASGGCYAVCQQGESCNEKTGLWETPPRRGRGQAAEACGGGFFRGQGGPGPALPGPTGAG